MDALEERVVAHGNHVGNLGVLSSKTEGKISGQQRRQEQLEKMVKKVHLSCGPKNAIFK